QSSWPCGGGVRSAPPTLQLSDRPFQIAVQTRWEDRSMRRIARARRPWWLACALMLSIGCGAGQTARPADPAQAQQALHAVLDAWKAGEKPEDLARRTPSIHVSDVDWRSGFRLVNYKAGDTGRLVGFDMNYPVVLELKDP